VPILGGVLGLVGFFALMDISIELTKIRKLLESEAALRRETVPEK
jgi:hypothetical protein